MTNDRRFVSDEFIARLDQKLDDHIDANNRDFQSIRDQLKPVAEFYEKVKWPMFAVGWGLMVVVLSFLTLLGNWTCKAIKFHLSR